MDIIYLLGSIQDKIFLRSVFKNFLIDTIFHTAAYKHVPIVEQNPIEGIKNKVAYRNDRKIFFLSFFSKIEKIINKLGNPQIP